MYCCVSAVVIGPVDIPPKVDPAVCNCPRACVPNPPAICACPSALCKNGAKEAIPDVPACASANLCASVCNPV